MTAYLHTLLHYFSPSCSTLRFNSSSAIHDSVPVLNLLKDFGMQSVMEYLLI